jgi:hypothetical protein
MPSDDVAAFVSDLAALIRKSALAAVHEALAEPSRSTSSSPAPAADREPAVRSPQRRSRSARTAAATTGGPAATPTRRGKTGEKRDPKIIAKITERVFEFIRSNPGTQMAKMMEGLGLGRRELVLPIAKLIASKRIARTGSKWSSTYSVVVNGLVQVPRRASKPPPKETKEPAAAG